MTQVGSTVVVTDQVVAGEPLDASLLVEADAARANQEQLAMIDAQ